MGKHSAYATQTSRRRPRRALLIRFVWNFPDHPPTKDWHFPSKLPKRGPVISKRIAGSIAWRIKSSSRVAECAPALVRVARAGGRRGGARGEPACRLRAAAGAAACATKGQDEPAPRGEHQPLATTIVRRCSGGAHRSRSAGSRRRSARLAPAPRRSPCAGRRAAPGSVRRRARW